VYKPRSVSTQFSNYFWGWIIPRKESGGLKEPYVYITKVLTEFGGTMLFTILGGASGNALNTKTDSAGQVTLTPGAGLNGAFNNAIALATCIYITAAYSGGKLNPAVSLALAFGAAQTIWEALFEIAAQFIGAILGALVLRGLLNEPTDACFAPGAGVTNNQIFGFEFIITLVLCLTVFATAVEGTSAKFQPIAPLAIGLSLFAGAQAAGTYTGAAANPARVVGPIIGINGCQKDKVGLYFAGQFLAAVVAAAIYVFRFWVSQTHCDVGPDDDAEDKAMQNHSYDNMLLLAQKSSDYNKALKAKAAKKWNAEHLADQQPQTAAAFRTGFMATDL
jgi:glycerol uptake facilitator-like aquaporin